ncbi:hypothetical protein PV328_011704 [Microctonus aethiopoides]|uniref:Uncharacterized protein n=1 Tax=Microctonus aethiopoides TaxID=144406 RepID=A0AA39EZV0_9HYME|nr:hypothetical protein PV328_011704 [Microctonus aethiopoides]
MGTYWFHLSGPVIKEEKKEVDKQITIKNKIIKKQNQFDAAKNMSSGYIPTDDMMHEVKPINNNELIIYNKNSDQDYIDENTKIVVNPSRTNDTIEDNQCQSEVENACACDSTDENKSTFNGKPRITSAVILSSPYDGQYKDTNISKDFTDKSIGEQMMEL